MPELPLHRGNFGPLQATRHDPVKIAEVGIHVEREAVIRDASLHGDSDGCDLFISDPNPRPRRSSLSCEAEACEGLNGGELDPAQIAVDRPSELRPQIHERIGDHLPRAVISDIAAPAGSVDGHLPGTEEVGVFAASANGEDMGMLDQEKDVGKSFPRFSFEEPLLERECS